MHCYQLLFGVSVPEGSCAPDPVYDRRRGAAVQIDGQHLAIGHLLQHSTMGSGPARAGMSATSGGHWHDVT